MNPKNFLKNLQQFFSCAKYFKFIEEHTQQNTITSITRDESGEIVVEISPTGSSSSINMNISDIFLHKKFIEFLTKKDRELIKLLITCEGDVFIESKMFKAENNDPELLNFFSVITDEKWTLSKEELLSNKELLARLNKKYFSKKLIV